MQLSLIQYYLYTHKLHSARRVLLKVFIAGFGCFLLCLVNQAVSAQVSAAFTVDSIMGCAPFTVHCTPTMPGNVVKWEWTTSDGQSSSDTNVIFIFSKRGGIRIKLKVSDYSVSDSFSRDIIVNGISPQFTYQYNNICSTPIPVQFAPPATTTPGNYHWDFGDGTVSIEAKPSHTYLSQGSYAIQLITYSNDGCVDSSTKTLQTGQVAVDFDAPASVCSSTPVTFTATSSSIPKSARWTINGVVVSGSINGFRYTFATAGTYTVKLTENFGGCTFSKEKQVTVWQRPTARFSESGTLQSCIYPSVVQYTNTSQGADSYSWYFGDSSPPSFQASPAHNYMLAGQFSPQLIASSANGCADTLVKTNLILLGPPIISRLQNLPHSRCLPDALKTSAFMVTPEPVVSYNWNFGDGGHSTDSSPAYTYTKQGYYDVSLIVSTASGCTDTFLVKKAVSAGDSVVPNFTVDKTTACASDSFHFTATTPSKVNSLQWNFGERAYSSNNYKQNYLYHTVGYQTVSLTANNNGCYVKTTKKDYVYIKPPVAKIAVRYDCTNQLNVAFADSSQQAQSWRWNFGDGSPQYTGQQPPLHQYTASGIYTVTLATANAECKSTDTLIVPVLNTKPVFTFTPSDGYLCRKASIIMGASNPEYIADYYWDFDNGKSAFSSTSISTYYDKAGVYKPSLVTKYKNGCRDTLYSPQPVHVTGPTAAFNTGAVPNCLNDAVTFVDKSLTDGAHAIVSWQWNSGDNYSKTQTSAPFSHSYAGYGNYKASLLIRDNNNCTDTAYYTVKVNKLPSISAGRDTFVCDGKNKVLLTATGGVSYAWNANASLSCVNCASPVASTFQSSAYIVTGTDANGCTNTDTVQVQVVRPFNMSVQPSSEICETKKALLSVSGADLYNWQPPDGLSNASSANPYASPRQTTKYIVTGQDKYHCFSQRGEVLVIVHPKPVFSIDSSLFIAQKGDINLLQTTGSDDIVSWQWSPLVGLSCTDCAQPYLTAVKSLTYTAIAATDYGCTDTDKVSIHVLCNQSKIYIPTAFTPNNDGRNDWFYVMSSIDNPVVSFAIYNRNGERLFSKTNILSNAPSQGWNGVYKGQPVSQDTYIYRIEMKCNDEVVPLMGTVTVVR